MATRSLTEPFILMRNNASQTRHIYSDQVPRNTNFFHHSLFIVIIIIITINAISIQNLSDRTALVGSEPTPGGDVELGGLNTGGDAPPAWSDALEETQYILSRLRAKLSELKELHAKHLTRPTLDDTSQV